MRFDAQIKAAQSIAAERVGAALQHDRCRLIELHHVGHHQLKYVHVVRVDDALAQRHVHWVVLAVVGAHLVHVAGAGKERVAVRVKRDGHDAIG